MKIALQILFERLSLVAGSGEIYNFDLVKGIVNVIAYMN